MKQSTFAQQKSKEPHTSLPLVVKIPMEGDDQPGELVFPQPQITPKSSVGELSKSNAEITEDSNISEYEEAEESESDYTSEVGSMLRGPVTIQDLDDEVLRYLALNTAKINQAERYNSCLISSVEMCMRK